ARRPQTVNVFDEEDRIDAEAVAELFEAGLGALVKITASDLLLAGVPDQVADGIADEPAGQADQEGFAETEQAVMGQHPGKEQGQVAFDHDAEEDGPQSIFSYQVVYSDHRIWTVGRLLRRHDRRRPD